MPAILFKLDRGLLLRIDHEVSLAPPGPVTRLGSIRDLLREALDARARSRGEPVFAPRAVSPPPEEPAPKVKKPTKAEKKRRERTPEPSSGLLDHDPLIPPNYPPPSYSAPPPVRRTPASGHVRRIGVSDPRKKGTT